MYVFISGKYTGCDSYIKNSHPIGLINDLFCYIGIDQLYRSPFQTNPLTLVHDSQSTMISFYMKNWYPSHHDRQMHTHEVLLYKGLDKSCFNWAVLAQFTFQKCETYAKKVSTYHMWSSRMRVFIGICTDKKIYQMILEWPESSSRGLPMCALFPFCSGSCY